MTPLTPLATGLLGGGGGSTGVIISIIHTYSLYLYSKIYLMRPQEVCLFVCLSTAGHFSFSRFDPRKRLSRFLLQVTSNKGSNKGQMSFYLINSQKFQFHVFLLESYDF